MYIYNGKLNWFNYAVDENVTFIFYGGFTPGQRVLACWQWTVDADGNEKVNTVRHGLISDSSLPSKLTITDDLYSFDCSLSRDLSSLEVNMRNENGDRDPSGATTLTNVYEAPTIYSSVVYAGKLDWWSSCRNEMVVVVLPDGVAAGSPVGMYYQWTQTSEGVKKQNYPVTTTFKTSGLDSDGQVTASYGGQFYTFTITLAKSLQTLSLDMTNPSGSKDPKSPYTLTLIKTIGNAPSLPYAQPDPPTSKGTYRIRKLLDTKYWQLAQSGIQDRLLIGTWVELNKRSRSDEQKWIIEPYKGENGEVQLHKYTITCVQGNTPLIAYEVKQGSVSYAPDGYPVGDEGTERPIWAMRPMEVDGYKFTRVYPTHPGISVGDLIPSERKVCEAHSINWGSVHEIVIGGKRPTEIVRFTKEAEENDLALPQDWVFEPVD